MSHAKNAYLIFMIAQIFPRQKRCRLSNILMNCRVLQELVGYSSVRLVSEFNQPFHCILCNLYRYTESTEFLINFLESKQMK